MHQSIGVTATINIVLVLLGVSFAFIFGTMSYSKAYRAGSIVVNALEKYEGYNALSKDEIEKRLWTLGYSVRKIGSDGQSINKCPETRTSSMGDGELVTIASQLGDTSEDEIFDYCIYYYPNDVKDADDNRHYSYGVVTYIEFEFNILGLDLRLPIYNHVRRIYKFNKVRTN